MLLLAAKAGPDLVRDLLIFPATDFRFARPESCPSVVPWGLLHPEGDRRGQLFALCRWACFAMPLGAALAGGAAGLRPSRAGGGEPRRRALVVALAVAFGLHFAAAHVQSNAHIVSMTPSAAALSGVLEGGPAPRRWARAAWLGAALAWCAVLLAKPVLKPLLAGERDRVALGLPGARSMPMDRVAAGRLRRLRALVDARVPPEAPIFVGELRHDIVIQSDVRLCFLLDRRPATRYHELHPAVADTAPIQREMVAGLKRCPPRLVLLRGAFDDALLDAFKKMRRRHVPALGARLLDRHLRERYREIAKLGRIHVLELAGPASDASAALPKAATLR